MSLLTVFRLTSPYFSLALFQLLRCIYKLTNLCFSFLKDPKLHLFTSKMLLLKDLAYLLTQVKALLTKFISYLQQIYIQHFWKLFSCLPESWLIFTINHVQDSVCGRVIHLPILPLNYKDEGTFLRKNWYLIEFCPPRSQTWNFRFLYSTVYMLKPMAVFNREITGNGLLDFI